MNADTQLCDTCGQADHLTCFAANLSEAAISSAVRIMRGDAALRILATLVSAVKSEGDMLPLWEAAEDLLRNTKTSAYGEVRTGDALAEGSSDLSTGEVR